MPFGSGFAPYEITDAMKRLRNIVPSEPWGLLKRKHAVFADEDFRSGPMDKQQAVSALLDCGVRFFAIPDIFIFHLWHPESLDNKYDRVRNECLWARRHRDTSRTYLLIGLGGILPHGLEGRLQNTMSRSDEQAVIKDSALAGTKASCEFGNSQNHNSPVVLGEVIVGPHAISRDLFARHLRLCVFFSSPAYYRETYNCSATARGNQAPSDYVRLFSESGNIHDAIASIENVSALFHLGDPNRCSRMFRNLTGVGVPVEWFEMEKCLATRARLRENQDRLLYPNEYLLYDFARACAGSFR